MDNCVSYPVNPAGLYDMAETSSVILQNDSPMEIARADPGWNIIVSDVLLYANPGKIATTNTKINLTKIFTIKNPFTTDEHRINYNIEKLKDFKISVLICG